MQFQDFSPPTNPSLVQQRDALQKGLGRAMHWAEGDVLDEELLLHACLHDQRYDPEFEDNRGEWLWKLMQLSGRVSRFRDPVLNYFRAVATEQDACQLCELALHFAKSGDSAFRQSLFDFVGERRFPDSPQIGEGQLISLGGAETLRFILRLRGRRLIDRAWDWDDEAVVDRALEVLGEPQVIEVLEDLAEPDVRRFTAAWRENRRSPDEGRRLLGDHQASLRSASAADVIRAAVTGDTSFNFRGWGIGAAEDELAAVLNRLWHEPAPEAIVRLLKVLSRRPLPTFDPRLIDFSQHSNGDVRRWALNVLEQNAHPLVRALALRELRQPTLGVSVVGLFIKNFQSGDERLLLDQADLPAEAWPRHGMLTDLVKLLESHADAESRELGQIAYFHTPCSSCRFRAARLLHAQQSAPDWLLVECRSDANEDCHALNDQE